MQSTRKPSSAPLSGPDSSQADVHDQTGALPLRRAQVPADGHPTVPAPASGDVPPGPPPEGAKPDNSAAEPAWWQAFVISQGVTSTRTPERILRERSGRTAGVATRDSVPAAPQRPVRVSTSSPLEQRPVPRLREESVVRNQIAALRSAYATRGSEGPTSEDATRAPALRPPAESPRVIDATPPAEPQQSQSAEPVAPEPGASSAARPSQAETAQPASFTLRFPVSFSWSLGDYRIESLSVSALS
jgi:hypothetical protein